MRKRKVQTINILYSNYEYNGTEKVRSKQQGTKRSTQVEKSIENVNLPGLSEGILD